MNSIFRRSSQGQVTPAVVVVRDRLIGAAITGLLTIIMGGVTYMAFTLPQKLQQLDAKDREVDKGFAAQDKINERVIGILEQHERRDDSHEMRLTKLEHQK